MRMCAAELRTHWQQCPKVSQQALAWSQSFKPRPTIKRQPERRQVNNVWIKKDNILSLFYSVFKLFAFFFYSWSIPEWVCEACRNNRGETLATGSQTKDHLLRCLPFLFLINLAHQLQRHILLNRENNNEVNNGDGIPDEFLKGSLLTF